MKTLANLASDQPGRKRRRAGGGDDDNFGANDEDWSVYRTVQTGDVSDDEEEEDLPAGLKNIEALLLQYDSSFTESHTLEAQNDWKKSILHAFTRGPRPFDPESQKEAHQIHLNVERIRVPEVVFQPAIAGVDQAGLVEIAADIINQRLTSPLDRDKVLKDVFLTGGNTLFRGFQDRLETELRAVLPTEAVLRVRKARDPVLDAWHGAAQWARGEGVKGDAVTREEWAEKGSEYLKVILLFSLPLFLSVVFVLASSASISLYAPLFLQWSPCIVRSSPFDALVHRIKQPLYAPIRHIVASINRYALVTERLLTRLPK